jgi:hypothetical protein
MDAHQFAEAVRAACIQAAVTAYEEAGIQGLCEEGRWEAAVGALKSIDLYALIQELESDRDRRAQ